MNGGIDFEFGQIDGRDAVLPGEKGGEVFLLDETELDQAGPQPSALGPLLLQGLGQLALVNQVLSDQQFSESVVFHIKMSLPS